MSLTIELRPETEAKLTALAAEQGVSPAHYLCRLIEEQIVGATFTFLSPEERAAAWRESVKGLPRTAPLSDAAISRESIYSDRG